MEETEGGNGAQQSGDVVDKIRHFFETNCTTSPCAKDIIRSRIGRNIRIEAPMLIMHDTLKKMYDKFVKVFKDVKIGLTEFKRLRPFNARAVKRSGCHCKVCEHYDGLRRGLQKAEDVSIVSPDEANVESPTTTRIKRSELQTKLNAGDEVTTSTGSYGRVRSQEGSVVQVEIDGDVRQCARNTIHLRHWVTKAFFGLTNDRKQYARAKRTCLHVS